MKIEKQVPTLGLCRSLKELGYPQEGVFYWCNPYMRACSDSEYKIYDLPTSTKDYVAPTVAELGEWLPVDIQVSGTTCSFRIYKYNKSKQLWGGYYIDNQHKNGDISTPSFGGKSLADTTAKMLIWLVENDYVSFDKK